MTTAEPTPGKGLISPTEHMLSLIDFQSQMSFATKSIDAVALRNNAELIAKAAAGIKVPTILTTVAEKSLSGSMFEGITAAFPGQAVLDRSSMNTWEDAAVIARVNEIGKPRVVLAGLWNGVASSVRRCRRSIRGSRSTSLATRAATSRRKPMIARSIGWFQAGARPMTSLQYLLELQRDWARSETYEMTTGVAKKFGGAYGLGIIYAKTMFSAHEG
jgi:hypothetical protein